MARRPTPPTPERPALSVPQLHRCIERLERCIIEVHALDPAKVRKRYGVPEVMAIEATIEEALSAAFGHNTPAFNRYGAAATLDNGPRVLSVGPLGRHIDHDARDAIEAQRYLAEGKPQSIALLKTAIKALRDEIADREAEMPVGQISASLADKSQLRKIFIVHGRDDGAKHEVALFVSRIGLEPIILHERPNKGRHLLTKFQEESEGARFAIVLMTPDDEGGVVGAGTQKRARQNVIFELGFFIGRLGASNVAALVKGDLERPSDFDGVVYIPIDKDGGWKALLARELHAANVPFDAKKVFEA